MGSPTGTPLPSPVTVPVPDATFVTPRLAPAPSYQVIFIFTVCNPSALSPEHVWPVACPLMMTFVWSIGPG